MTVETLSKLQEAKDILGVRSWHDLYAAYADEVKRVALSKEDWDPDDQSHILYRVRTILRSIESKELNNVAGMYRYKILTYPLPKRR